MIFNCTVYENKSNCQFYTIQMFIANMKNMDHYSNEIIIEDKVCKILITLFSRLQFWVTVTHICKVFRVLTICFFNFTEVTVVQLVLKNMLLHVVLVDLVKYKKIKYKTFGKWVILHLNFFVMVFFKETLPSKPQLSPWSQVLVIFCCNLLKPLLYISTFCGYSLRFQIKYQLFYNKITHKRCNM